MTIAQLPPFDLRVIYDWMRPEAVMAARLTGATPQYWLDDAKGPIAASSLLTTTRSSSIVLPDSAGVFQTLGNDTLPRTDRGLYGNGQIAALNANGNNPQSGTGWSNVVAPNVSNGPTIDGFFRSVYVAATGGAGRLQRRGTTANLTTVSGAPLAIKIRFGPGQSDNINVYARFGNSSISGTRGAAIVDSLSSGPLVIVSQSTEHLDVVWTPNITSSTQAITVGPFSDIAGQDIRLDGIDVTNTSFIPDAWVSTDWPAPPLLASDIRAVQGVRPSNSQPEPFPGWEAAGLDDGYMITTAVNIDRLNSSVARTIAAIGTDAQNKMHVYLDTDNRIKAVIGALDTSPPADPWEKPRQVATRCIVPSSMNDSFSQIFSRTIHKAAVDITEMKVEFANWYISTSTGETATGADATIYAAIEYPIGSTPIRLTFGGADSGVIPDGGNLLTDLHSIAIPAGEDFAIKTFFENPECILFTSVNRTGGVEGWQGGTGELTDQTTSTTNPSTLSGTSYVPVAIIGPFHDQPVAFLAGDSKVVGATDTGSRTLKGEFERSLGGYAFISAGRSSDSLQSVLTNGYSRRLALSQYCTHVFSNYGINGLSGGAGAGAAMAARIEDFAAFFNLPFFQATVAPYTTSTDNWATVENQTPNASNANRIILNDLIRAGLDGVTGYVEIADVVESGRNSGRWKPGHTSDGIHENATGYQAVQDSGVVKIPLVVLQSDPITVLGDYEIELDAVPGSYALRVSDGIAGDTDPSTEPLPAGATTLRVGSDFGVLNPFNGWIEQIQIARAA